MRTPVLTLPVAPPRAPAPHGAARWLRAARIVHPFPTLLNVAATAALACVAARGVLEASLLIRMLLVMLLAQSAIGVANDYCDRALDAAAKPWKPIAAGLMAPRTALAASCALVAAAALAAATLGAGGFALAMLGMSCGIAYDVRLKRSIFSAVPYMIAIPVLPLWVWTVLGAWQDALWWLLPLGALIGLALHLANTLPDIDADAAHDVRGLAHRLGARGSMIAAWAAFAAALALSAAIAPLVRYDAAVYMPAASFGAACLAVSIAAYARRRDGAALQFGFGVLGIGAAALATGWLAAVT
jgi:4-hydroxybenzoate polyprenyltransferase